MLGSFRLKRVSTRLKAPNTPRLDVTVTQSGGGLGYDGSMPVETGVE